MQWRGLPHGQCAALRAIEANFIIDLLVRCDKRLCVAVRAIARRTTTIFVWPGVLRCYIPVAICARWALLSWRPPFLATIVAEPPRRLSTSYNSRFDPSDCVQIRRVDRLPLPFTDPRMSTHGLPVRPSRNHLTGVKIIDETHAT